MAFGRSSRWSVGVEEELLLVDELTYAPVAASPVVLEHAPEGFKRELFAAMLETTTGVCASPAEARAQMRGQRARAAEIAASHGLRVLAAGSHPLAIPEDQPTIAKDEYLEFVSFGGPVARRQLVCGLHVHVGMPDAETALRALEGVLGWLPVVLALSANSPFFRARRTGLLSTRAEVLATLPRSGAPPRFDTFADWSREMHRWQAAGLVRRYTNVWWDARIHPHFGTLEVRVADQPTDVEVAASLVELVHELVVRAAEGAPPPTPRLDYQTNRFAAARFGPRAKLIWGDTLVPVERIARELGRDAVCEADWQLERGDDLGALCAELADRT